MDYDEYDSSTVRELDEEERGDVNDRDEPDNYGRI